MPVGDGSRGRVDNRLRHDGKDADPAHQPGPVVPLDPQTMQPKRINVTAQDRAASETANRAASEAMAGLTFDQQKEAIRRANSVLLSRVLAAIEGGSTDPDTVNNLGKCSTIAKQWTAEERQQGDSRDATQLTDDEIKQRLGQ